MPGPFYFSWAGGTIEPQIVVVTNGSTWGTIFQTVSLVGDTQASQLVNVASQQGLEEGVFYELSGPGIASGTWFVADQSILSGLPDSLNLSAATSGTHVSTTFTATKSIPVGIGLGTLVQGSAAVTLVDVAGLPAGVYGVSGTGIGQTNIPVHTMTGTTYTGGGGVMIVSSCVLHYDGAGHGTLAILAATPHTTSALDMFGMVTNVTTYTVAEQPVLATATGQFPLELSGFPTGDRAQITGIPAGVLASLTPGLRYNISGNGIPLGATFAAPAGGTSIELDVLATATELNAVLTITGPRTPNAGSFDPSIHDRFDVDVIDLEISQEEGGFATLTIRLKNPGVGLLQTGRNLWCWLSWDSAWSPLGTSTPVLVPLFNGRLVGVPRLQAGEIVELHFLARPDDLNAQKLTLSSALQVAPYYDPVWLAGNLTPDTVLETYSALWHIDRVSLGLTISDILNGEDGTVAIGEDQAIYDKFSLAYGQPPLVAVTVSGTVGWRQEGDGRIDVTQRLLDAFKAAGSAYAYTFATSNFNVGGGGLIQVLCGEGIRGDWPRPGAAIGGGWALSTLNDGAGYPLCYIVDATITTAGGWFRPTTFNVQYAGQQPLASQAGNTTAQSNVNVYLNAYNQYMVQFPLDVYKIRMNLEYRADRRRTETVNAVLTAGVQQELSDSAENDRESIAMTSEYVAQGVDPNGALPIGNLAYRSYFQTDRGAQSLEYLLLAARAKMRARARAVDVSFGLAWSPALAITLRKNVQLTDRRLPGGMAIGKVKSYKLTAGIGGMWGEFTIGCTIGTGAATAAQPGVNSYVEDGYVDPPYQVVSGAQLTLGTGDLAYQALDNFVIDDDGVNLTTAATVAATAFNECVVTNGLKVQLPLLGAYNNTVLSTGSPLNAMRTLTTTCTLDMKPLTGAEFHTNFWPAISMLSLPKTIDLGAA